MQTVERTALLAALSLVSAGCEDGQALASTEEGAGPEGAGLEGLEGLGPRQRMVLSAHRVDVPTEVPLEALTEDERTGRDGNGGGWEYGEEMPEGDEEPEVPERGQTVVREARPAVRAPASRPAVVPAMLREELPAVARKPRRVRLSKMQIRKGIARNLGVIEMCDNSRVRWSGTAGIVVDHCPGYPTLPPQTMRIGVAANGLISWATLGNSTLDLSPLGSCFLDEVAEWRFSMHGGELPSKIRIPVTFDPCETDADGVCLWTD